MPSALPEGVPPPIDLEILEDWFAPGQRPYSDRLNLCSTDATVPILQRCAEATPTLFPSPNCVYLPFRA